jgi:hypothetical protein
MDEHIDVAVDSAADTGPHDPNAVGDSGLDAAGLVTKPGHVIRENVDPIAEADPPQPKESDAVPLDADLVMPDAEEADEKWKAEMKDAAVRWDRLTDKDLLALGRHKGSLTELVQQRYSISSADAALQVREFISDHQSFAL